MSYPHKLPMPLFSSAFSYILSLALTYRYPDQMALRDAGDPEPLEETYNYMQDHKLAPYKPVVLHFSNGNRYKLYTTAPGSFYRYYPEHKYIKDGLDIIRSAH